MESKSILGVPSTCSNHERHLPGILKIICGISATIPLEEQHLVPGEMQRFPFVLALRIHKK